MVDGGSAWEDKNLDYLVSPDQGGEVSAQFSSRQQQEKLLAGTSLASPPPEKHSPSKTPDTETNQQTQHDSNTLRREIHALATPLENNKEKPEGEVATRENIYDEQGRIIDVLFSQNGNQASLKSVLPGTYTIEFTHYPEDDRRSNSQAKPHQNKLTLNESGVPEAKKEANVTLVHESSHMIDYQENKEKYDVLQKEIVVNTMKLELLVSRRFSLKDQPIITFAQGIDFSRRRLQNEELTQKFLPETYQSILQEFDGEVEKVAAMTSLEEVNQLIEEQEPIANMLRAKMEMQTEHNAWEKTVKAIRELKQQGITLFAGTDDELYAIVDKYLFSYYVANNNYLEPAEQKFKERRFA